MSTTSTTTPTATAAFAELLAERWRAAWRSEIRCSELLGLRADAVDELLAARGRRERLGHRGIDLDLALHVGDVRGHVEAGGGGQRGRSADERPIAPRGLLERERGRRQIRLRRLRRRQEHRLARDHIAAKAGLGVDDVALEVDRGVEVRAGAKRRVGGRAKVDDVHE